MATRQEGKEREGITIEEMAEAIGSAMPQLDATEQRIAIGIYRLLAEGEAVSSGLLLQKDLVGIESSVQ